MTLSYLIIDFILLIGPWFFIITMNKMLLLLCFYSIQILLSRLMLFVVFEEFLLNMTFFINLFLYSDGHLIKYLAFM